MRSTDYCRREGYWPETVVIIWVKDHNGLDPRWWECRDRDEGTFVLYIIGYVIRYENCWYLDIWILRWLDIEVRKKGFKITSGHWKPQLVRPCILFTSDVAHGLTCWCFYTLAAGCCVLPFCWQCRCDQTYICICGVLLTGCHGNLPGDSCLMAFMNRNL